MPGSLLAEVEDELAGESALVQEGDYDNFMLGDAFDGDEEPLPKPASEPAVVPAEPAESTESAPVARRTSTSSPKSRRVSAFGTCRPCH